MKKKRKMVVGLEEKKSRPGGDDVSITAPNEAS